MTYSNCVEQRTVPQLRLSFENHHFLEKSTQNPAPEQLWSSDLLDFGSFRSQKCAREIWRSRKRSCGIPNTIRVP